MTGSAADSKSLLAKVPQITALFWLIKILTTGIRRGHVRFPRAQESRYRRPSAPRVSCRVRLAVRTRRYLAPPYWLTVAMVAVVGTMVADVCASIGVSYCVVERSLPRCSSPCSSASGTAREGTLRSTASIVPAPGSSSTG